MKEEDTTEYWQEREEEAWEREEYQYDTQTPELSPSQPCWMD